MLKYVLLMLLPFLQGCFNKNSLKLLWQAPIASESTPIVQDGMVYISGKHAGHPEEPYRLFALDALSGKINWISADSVKMVYGLSGGFVFFRNMAEHLVQLDARSGEILHESSDSDTPILHWGIQDDVMFIINTAMEVVAVDNRQNKVLWRMKTPFGPHDETDLQMAGQYVIVSGNFRGEEQFGSVWALDATTGKEIWHFEVPHEYAPLKVLVYEPYVLVTNTSPLHLQTHVLDVHTGKELYPPIYAFDFRGCYEHTAHASGGAFDLQTGKRTGETAPWIAGSVIYKGLAWKQKMGSVGIEGFFLRTTYDGDYRGKRNWLDTPPNSSIEGFDIQTGKSVSHTKEYKYTQFSPLVEAGGILFHSSIAVMKEGKSGVWAYRLP